MIDYKYLEPAWSAEDTYHRRRRNEAVQLIEMWNSPEEFDRDKIAQRIVEIESLYFRDSEMESPEGENQ